MRMTKQISSKLVESNDLSICVLNIQAFNKDTNILRKTDEYEQNLWEDIKYIKPIVIIDEPQKIEGTKKKKSKSLVAIEELKPFYNQNGFSLGKINTLMMSMEQLQPFLLSKKLDSSLEIRKDHKKIKI